MNAFPRSIDVPELILELRRLDLVNRVEFHRPENRAAYMFWLITHGLKRYTALREDPGFLASVRAKVPEGSLTRLQQIVWQGRKQLQTGFPLPERLKEYTQWFYTRGLEEFDIWSLLSDAERGYLLQHEPWKSRHPHLDSTPELSFAQRPFGVNVIGYAFGQLGIGEDARMAARAFKAVGVPFTMVDFQPGAHIPQDDRSMASHVTEEGPYAFNLFCMTAQEHSRFYLERGCRQFEGRYNIGYWPWELPRWPKPWEAMTSLVDEVWVSTRHIYDALAPVSSVPVLVMPMAVELGKVARKTRADFGLPKKAVLFAFSFDLNSYVHRKNPQACVDAFSRAFPLRGGEGLDRERVGLVIKTHAPKRPDSAWKALKTLAEKDDRIHIVEETLDRPQLLALYKNCDCFLSLHRAEGFGRGLAECLQLGLHVITTGYSGNVDFCRPPESDLVDYKMVWVGDQQYPYGDGQVWAEPDIEHAATLMRAFSANHGKRANKRAWPEFSTKVIGDRYLQRLESISRWAGGTQ